MVFVYGHERQSVVILFKVMSPKTLLAFITLLLLTPAVSLAQAPFLLPVQTSLPNNTVATTTSTVTPMAIDLIIEADTYVPYFYNGRREPVAGSNIRLTAVTLGEGAPATYRWQIGSQYLTTTTASTNVTLPKISSDIKVSVTAVNSTGTALGSATEYIRPAIPKVIFYETNNLRGTNNVAVTGILPLIGNEALVRAEPYFFGVGSLLSGAVGVWTAGKTNIVMGNDWRNVSIVRRENGATNTDDEIRLEIRSRNNIAETAIGTFKLSI